MLPEVCRTFKTICQSIDIYAVKLYNLGMQMLIILSGLQYISEELYEAAEIDGCTTFQKFIYITVPGLKNTLVYILVSTI